MRHYFIQHKFSVNFAIIYTIKQKKLSEGVRIDRLCGLVVRVLATDTEVSGSIPGATRFSE